MNIKKETIKKLEDLGYIVWFSMGTYFCKNDNDYENATHMEISSLAMDGPTLRKTIKAPKKEVTVNWVLEKLHKESVYYNLSQYLKKIFGYGMIYPTSYGIGVETIWNMKENAKKVERKLNELGLSYRNEYSDAGWVYRFVISKDKKNIEIMKQL